MKQSKTIVRLVAILKNIKVKSFLAALAISFFFYFISSNDLGESLTGTESVIEHSKEEILKGQEVQNQSLNKILEKIDDKEMEEANSQGKFVAIEERNGPPKISPQVENTAVTKAQKTLNHSISNVEKVNLAKPTVSLPIEEELDLDEYFRLGEVSLANKNYEAAIPNFEAAYNIDNGHMRTLVRLSYSYYKRGREIGSKPLLHKSLKKYSEAILQNDLDIKLRYNRAKVYKELGSYKLEIIDLEYFLQNLTVQHENLLSSALSNLGNAHKHLNNFDKSAKYYKQVIDLDPTIAKSHYNYAFVLYQGKEYQRAHQAFDKVLELGYNKSDVLQYQKICERELKEQKKAILSSSVESLVK